MLFNKQRKITITMTSNKNLVLDLSLIFDEYGYIKENDYVYKYYININNEIIEHITLIQSIDSPIKIGNNFLRNYTALITIDTSKLINIFAIGDNFLRNCKKLQTLNIQNLTSLITIGDFFLGSCFKLKNIYMTNLTSVESIDGIYFLYACYPTIFVNKISNYLRDKIKCRKNVELYIKPIIHLDNNCVI